MEYDLKKVNADRLHNTRIVAFSNFLLALHKLDIIGKLDVMTMVYLSREYIERVTK